MEAVAEKIAQGVQALQSAPKGTLTWNLPAQIVYQPNAPIAIQFQASNPTTSNEEFRFRLQLIEGGQKTQDDVLDFNLQGVGVVQFIPMAPGDVLNGSFTVSVSDTGVVLALQLDVRVAGVLHENVARAQTQLVSESGGGGGGNGGGGGLDMGTLLNSFTPLLAMGLLMSVFSQFPKISERKS